jgi:hypothetical protein
MTDADVTAILYAVQAIMRHAKLWARDYRYDPSRNDYLHPGAIRQTHPQQWLTLPNVT